MALCPLGKALHPICLVENVPVLTVSRSGSERLLNVNVMLSVCHGPSIWVSRGVVPGVWYQGCGTRDLRWAGLSRCESLSASYLCSSTTHQLMGVGLAPI